MSTVTNFALRIIQQLYNVSSLLAKQKQQRTGYGQTVWRVSSKQQRTHDRERQLFSREETMN